MGVCGRWGVRGGGRSMGGQAQIVKCLQQILQMPDRTTSNFALQLISTDGHEVFGMCRHKSHEFHLNSTHDRKKTLEYPVCELIWNVDPACTWS